MPESCALIMLRDRSPDVLWGEWFDAPREPFAGRSSPCLCSEGSAAARWTEDAAALTAQFDAAMAHKRAVAVNSFVIAIAIWLFLLLVLGATDRSVLRAALNLCAPAAGARHGGSESERRLAASMDAAAL